MSKHQATPQKNDLERFADDNNLQFKKGVYENEIHLAGTYKGNRMKLNTIYDTLTKRCTFTQVVFLANQTEVLPAPDKEEAVKEVVALLTPSLKYKLKGQVGLQSKGQIVYYQQTGFEQDTKYLSFIFDLLSDLTKLYTIANALSGMLIISLQTIPAKEKYPLRSIAIQYLEEIATDSIKKFAHIPYLLCPDCIVYGARTNVDLPWLDTDITYYGCRSCGQSNLFKKHAGPIIATLDNTSAKVQTLADDILYVNWLIWRKSFDFNQVQIIQASDEDIERFVMQIGNDTDDFRQTYYKTMPCSVSADYTLSENSRRVLKQVFESITIESADA